MFVDKNRNRELALRLWEGKPSGQLLWMEDLNWANFTRIAQDAGHEDAVAYGMAELGCLFPIVPVTSVEISNPSVETTRRATDGDETIEHRSSAGTLTERQRKGQIIKNQFESVADLQVLVEMWRHLEVRQAPELYSDVIPEDASAPGKSASKPVIDPLDWRRVRARYAPQVPVALQSKYSSAIQYLMQHVTGVEHFYYLLADNPTLVEDAMAAWQAMLEKQYRVMASLGVPRFYQSENTSTAMISPEYFKRYSMGHLQQLTAAARQAGARTITHMCGHLRDLLPLIAQTGVNGIHMVTPAPLGNTAYEDVFRAIPAGFTVLGCFGSLDWIGKTSSQLLENLRRVLPHHLYKERAFALIVTSDRAPFTRADLERVRDAITAYERQGNEAKT